MANIKSIYGNPVVDDSLRKSVAAEYSSSSTYAVGDLVLKDGQLYECNTAISTAEAWNSSHWTSKTVADEFSDLKEDLTTVESDVTDLKDGLQSFGTYKQSFTMNNQYLASFITENNGGIYFELLTYEGSTAPANYIVYGVKNGTDTEIVRYRTSVFQLSGISAEYDQIKVAVGFGSRTSGEVTAILSNTGGGNFVSTLTNNTLDLENLSRSLSPTLTGDLYLDIPFIENKNIVSDFSTCNIETYQKILRDSQVGSVASHVVKIRDKDGNQICPIYFVVPDALNTNSATCCWTFDKDGNPLGNISGSHLNDGFASNIYYILLVSYSTARRIRALYLDMEYTFEVAKSGKPYTSFSECIKNIANVPFKKKVLVYSGTYDVYTEIGGDTYANSIPSGTNWRTVSVVVENNTHIVGIGNVTLQMTPENINSTAASLLSPLNISGDVVVENINVLCSNCRYGVHIEGSTLEKYNNTTCILKNVNVTRNTANTGAQSNGPAIGVGMNARSKLILEGCHIYAQGGWACLYFHENTTTEELSPVLRIFDSVMDIRSGYALALSASANQTTLIDTYIASSYIKSLRKMTGGSSAFNDAYKIVMLNCNMPDITASDLMENEISIEHYNTIA